jgi:hypothetical protein
LAAALLPADRRAGAPPWLVVLLGVVVTLCVRGYRYGESNHAVYLVDALRRLDPTLLANDWWTQQTLQYHFVFNALSGWLMRIGLIEPAFLAGYLALAVLLHVGWYQLVRAVGGDAGAYAVSVLLFYALGAGLGLGSYHFLQDSSFLPSNISNVAMLWGILLWTRRRWGAAGAALGLAGLFHINHALMAIGLWGALAALEWTRLKKRGHPEYSATLSGRTTAADRNLLDVPFSPARGMGGSPMFFLDDRKDVGGPPMARRCGTSWLVGTITLLLLSAPAIAPAVRTVLSRSASIPRAQFVDLFVHLRHPHHFDPLTWHWALWVIFLLPIPLAVAYARRALRGDQASQVRRAADVFLVLAGVTLVALLGAGVWFVSETLVQLNLYRFSICLKLLACVGAGCRLAEAGALRPRGRRAIVALAAAGMIGVAAASFALTGPAAALVQRNAAAVLLALAAAGAAVALAGGGRVPRAAAAMMAMLMVVTVTLFWPRLGLTIDAVRGDPPEYVDLARWARDNTPAGAVFLVSPAEQAWRLHARRAIVVNYKNVPQLGAELPEWRNRLQRVLDLPDLMALPKGMGRTLDAIEARYDALPPEHLARAAARYGAAYVVTGRPGGAPAGSGLCLMHQSGRFGLYSVEAAPQSPAAGGAAR